MQAPTQKSLARMLLEAWRLPSVDLDGFDPDFGMSKRAFASLENGSTPARCAHDKARCKQEASCEDRGCKRLYASLGQEWPQWQREAN